MVHTNPTSKVQILPFMWQWCDVPATTKIGCFSSFLAKPWVFFKDPFVSPLGVMPRRFDPKKISLGVIVIHTNFGRQTTPKNTYNIQGQTSTQH